MKRWAVLMTLLVFTAVGCSSTAKQPTAPGAVATTRLYSGTASVGDFMSITLDAAAHTLAYVNHSNGDSGTVPYTVNGDGTYALADTTGNLLTAYEVPNFVLLVQAAKTGPDHSTMSLVTAVQQAPTSVATIAGHRYNYMQLRTASGGLEVGSAICDGAGVVSNSRYWPFGAMSGSNPFNTGEVSSASFEEDASGNFMRLPDGSGTYDYMFGTPNGIWAVDTPSGAILGLAQASSKDFASANAGTYTAIYYGKTGAQTGMGNVESGTPALGNATLAITSGGVATMTDSQGAVLVTGTLTPIADCSYLYGTDKLADPCNGLFTIRSTTGAVRQDAFVAFLSGAALFSSFKADTAAGGSGTYDYFYGGALK